MTALAPLTIFPFPLFIQQGEGALSKYDSERLNLSSRATQFGAN